MMTITIEKHSFNTMYLNHLILITILIKCDYPHFTNQETEPHGDWRLPTCVRLQAMAEPRFGPQWSSLRIWVPKHYATLPFANCFMV